MASHAAARRAVQAGYTNVSVMVDGIAGWANMHERVEHVSVEQAGGGGM
jgi:rhodanese-related sulfurtransferase